MRLVAYIRVSKVAGRSGESFQSPGQQRQAIEHAVALRAGAEVVEWIEELDESGGSMDRPGLQNALRMVEADEADGIVVAKLDRFARATAAIDVIERLERAGKVFISAADHFDTSTAVGRFALGMMVLVARLERDRHIETWQATVKASVGRGVHSVVPYGYRRKAGKGSALEPVEPQASVVRRIFAARLAGEGIASIADSLNADGIPSPRGNHWTRQTVRRVLRSRSYTGEAHYADNSRQDAHEPLVDRATWQAAQPRTGAPHRASGSLLAGMVRCAGCGYIMGASTSNGQRRYSCQRYTASGRCPSPTTAPAEKLEQLVTSEFLGRYGFSAEPGSLSNAAVREAEREVERLADEFAAWRDDTELRQALGTDHYREGLIARRRALNAAESSHQQALRAAGATSLGISPDLWSQLATPERRRLLGIAIDAVLLRRAASTVTPLAERVEILWTPDMRDDPTGGPLPA